MHIINSQFHRFVAATAFALTALFISGCSSAPKVTPQLDQSIKRIGVLSVLPEEMTFRKIGTTVFNNEAVRQPVGQIYNDAAFSAAQSALNKPGRAIIKLDPGVPGKLAAQMRSNSFVINSRAESISKELKAMIASHQLDAVVVIRENFDNDNGLYGIDFFMRTAFGLDQAPVVRAALQTILVDTNVKSLGQSYNPYFVPAQKVGQGRWTYSLKEDLDEQTKAQIIRQSQQGVDFAVKSHLRNLGFTGN